MSTYFCTKCYADLDNQRGFDPRARTWFCNKCGQLLVNPNMEDRTTRFNEVEWFCDNCGSHLNLQAGFSDWCDEWECSICGYVNKIDISEIIEL